MKLRSSILLFLLPFSLNAQKHEQVKISLLQPIPLKEKPKQIQWPASNVATQCYGFFCKQELKLDKQTAVPLRFRLGSMQQNDWLESKPNTTKPQQ